MNSEEEPISVNLAQHLSPGTTENISLIFLNFALYNPLSLNAPIEIPDARKHKLRAIYNQPYTYGVISAFLINRSRLVNTSVWPIIKILITYRWSFVKLPNSPFGICHYSGFEIKVPLLAKDRLWHSLYNRWFRHKPLED